jgi:precorrin-6B methylase 2
VGHRGPSLRLGDLLGRLGLRRRPKVRAESGSAPVGRPTPRFATDALWGEGFASPGGREFVRAIARGLGLSPGMHVAEIESGRGGAGCVLAQDIDGVRVTAFARSAEDAAAARELSLRLNVADRLTTATYDPAAPVLPAEAFDHVLAKDGVPLDPKLLAALHVALKPKGRLRISQLVANGGGFDASARDILPASCAASVPSLAALKTNLETSGFSIVEDEATSEAFTREIRRGWARFAEALNRDPRGWGDLRAILAACERWVRISKDLQAGNLEHHTITAERV